MFAFRCPRCSKVNISNEGYHCLYCEDEETRITSIPEIPAQVRSAFNIDNDNFLHMRNIFTETDCSILLPRAINNCNAAQLNASEEKDTETLDTSGSHLPSSQGEDKSVLDSFAKDGIHAIQLKDNLRKVLSGKILIKNSTPTVYNSFQDDMQITKASAVEVSPKGCTKNDFSEKWPTNSMKTQISKNLLLSNKCGNTFTDKSKLKVSLRKPLKQDSFKCDRCDKKYISEARLKKHYKSHTDKPIKCNLWDLVFTKNSHLGHHRKKHILEDSARQKRVDKSHQKEQETNGDDSQKHFQSSAQEKIFPCTKCGAKFIRESDFNAHSLRHSVQKPFKCKECNKEFRYECALNKHYHVHSLERIFFCKTCGFSATHGNIINRHFKWCQFHSLSS